MEASARRALLDGIIDYAGLFPPATLPMAEAWREYGRHRASPQAWMLGRFICPAARLEELAACLQPEESGVSLALLAARAPEAAALSETLAADEAGWARFRTGQSGRARVEAWELRLPEDSPDGDALEAMLAKGRALLSPDTDTFWEAGPDWDRGRLEALAEVLVRLNAGGGRHGLKLRCGGVTAAEFPTLDRVAMVITLCRDHGLPLKLTAGLHHPLRHWRPEPGVWMHGFLNVYFAAMAALTHGLAERDLLPILSETRRDLFRLREGELSWRELRVETSEVREARRLLPGHGSCSFDEPVADLRALGWLESGGEGG
jgi:hypothetical protein